MNMPPNCQSSAPKKSQFEGNSVVTSRARGWHSALKPVAPHRGKGSATVDPIRELKDIARIKGGLADNPRDLSLFVVGIHVGLRGSDLLALRWADVLDDEDIIRDRISVRERKTGNTRHIAIHEKVRQTLNNWKIHAGDFVNANAYVWPNRTDGPLTIQRLHQLVNYWCSTIELRGNFGTHTLRKTYGYHLRRLGYDVDLLMKVFGHSSSAVTLRYIGIEQEEIDEANLRLVL